MKEFRTIFFKQNLTTEFSGHIAINVVHQMTWRVMPSNAMFVPWDEARFSGLKNVLYNFICLNLVVHADKNRNPSTFMVLRPCEELKQQRIVMKIIHCSQVQLNVQKVA